jgi:hypothetical protein
VCNAPAFGRRGDLRRGELASRPVVGVIASNLAGEAINRHAESRRPRPKASAAEMSFLSAINCFATSPISSRIGRLRVNAAALLCSPTCETGTTRLRLRFACRSPAG